MATSAGGPQTNGLMFDRAKQAVKAKIPAGSKRFYKSAAGGGFLALPLRGTAASSRRCSLSTFAA